jgi:type I restriction enzyme S subunit
MMRELKLYPTMKDSGVRWLGEVPVGWEIRRNGRLFAERKETGFPDLPILEVSLKTGVRVRDFRLSQRKQVMADRAKYKRAANGDIAYNMMRMWQGAVGVASTDGLVSPAYVVARPLPGTVPRYFAYLYRISAYMGEVNNYSHGIVADRNRLYWAEFKQIPTPYPPPDEQSAIVRFLDHTDRRIRRYIQAKQKLIKLLEEQKQAIIHRAVTRGLDSNVRLKPSGVDWLGDVPEHWKVVPLKFLSRRVQNGATPITSEPAFYENGTAPWYGPSSCGRREEVGTPVRYLTEAAFREGRARLILGPALLIVVIGATAGKMTLLTHEGSTNQQITSYELRTERVNPYFILRQIRGAERWLRTTASTATIPILDATEVGRLPVAVPSRQKQEEIVRYTDERTTGIRRAIDRAAREIDFLREYRTRLIADVVTGKLDVREAATKLPDVPEESELPLASDELDEEADVDLGGDAEVEE